MLKMAAQGSSVGTDAQSSVTGQWNRAVPQHTPRSNATSMNLTGREVLTNGALGDQMKRSMKVRSCRCASGVCGGLGGVTGGPTEVSAESASSPGDPSAFFGSVDAGLTDTTTCWAAPDAAACVFNAGPCSHDACAAGSWRQSRQPVRSHSGCRPRGREWACSHLLPSLTQRGADTGGASCDVVTPRRRCSLHPVLCS